MFHEYGYLYHMHNAVASWTARSMCLKRPFSSFVVILMPIALFVGEMTPSVDVSYVIFPRVDVVSQRWKKVRILGIVFVF